jgi:hypothetical protein
MAGGSTRTRADLGFAPAPEDLDLSGFAPRQRPAAERPGPAVVAEAAAAAGFTSREPRPALVPPAGEDGPPRRRRTGRSAQFNLKARPETVAAYCALADRMGWGLGETLERAVALLEQEYGAGGPR